MSHGQTDSSNVANCIPSRPANSSMKVLWADSSKESSSFQAQLRSLRSVAPAADTKPWRSPGPMSQMTSMPTLHLHWGKWPELTDVGFKLFLFLASDVRQTWPDYIACVVGSGWHRTRGDTNPHSLWLSDQGGQHGPNSTSSPVLWCLPSSIDVTLLQ